VEMEVPVRRARAQTGKRSDWLRPAMEHTDGIDMGWLVGGMDDETTR
jgi:hypothetical protein